MCLLSVADQSCHPCRAEPLHWERPSSIWSGAAWDGRPRRCGSDCPLHRTRVPLLKAVCASTSTVPSPEQRPEAVGAAGRHRFGSCEMAPAVRPTLGVCRMEPQAAAGRLRKRLLTAG